MSNTNSIIERVNSVINSAAGIASSMQNGDRIQLKELALRASKSSNLDIKDALNLVSMFARSTDLGYVSRGKNGGFIRGTKPAKTPPAQISDVKNNSTVDDTDESDDDFDSDDE